jgi:rhodanese-related sulfurtransferase
MAIENIDPHDVARRLEGRSIVLIDVREPPEFAAERIAGALLFPLSSFDAKALPRLDGQTLVFHCGSGVRSAKAVATCQAAVVAVGGHMKGGIQAWKAAGLPTLETDPD